MIDKTGKVELSNGAKSIWVRPDDAASWAVHGYSAVNSPVAAVLRAPAKQDLKVEEILPKEINANEENE